MGNITVGDILPIIISLASDTDSSDSESDKNSEK
jgi:hypothetical protein